MAGIHFDITGDNSNFLRRLREVENGVKNTSKQIEQSGLGIEELLNRMTRAAAAFGAGFTAKELISILHKSEENSNNWKLHLRQCLAVRIRRMPSCSNW